MPKETLLETGPVLAAPKYMTVIPSRRPKEKLHKSLGHVKNALNGKFYSYARGAYEDMQAYEWIDNAWVLLYDVKEGDAEPPWREGERAAKVAQQLKAKEEAERRRLLKISAFAKEEVAKDTDPEEAYLRGYLKALQEEM